MTTERVEFTVEPGSTFADTESRTISGLAVPLGATANKGGRVWRFLRDSVTFGDRTPLLAYHDPTRPVGKLTSSRWSDDGLRVKFAVSKTSGGDEALQLANDGVVGLSVGIDVPEGGAKLIGDELHVSAARAAEVSLTPIPAFAGSVIDKVALSGDHPGRTAHMPDDVTPTPVTVNLDATALGTAIATAFAANHPTQPTEPAEPGPEPQPVPNAQTTVREEAPYRFDGTGGKFGFVADCVASTRGDGAATDRLNTFIRETFVATTDTGSLNPTRNRSDLYVGNLYRNRPLASAITMGTLPDITPFVFPKFATSGNLVNPHVEGVEPSLATFTATNQTVNPAALSGKAEITRELWDQGGSPQVDQLIWTEMLQASVEAAEERVAAMLDGLAGLDTIAVTGTNAAAVDDVVAALAALQYERGGNRFSSMVLAQDLYTALVNAADADGRKLLPTIGATNANGTTASNFGSVSVGNATGVPAWGLTGDSYMLVPSSVYQWISTPQRLTFDIQVKSVYVALWQYSAEAVTRDSDVKKLTYSAT